MKEVHGMFHNKDANFVNGITINVRDKDALKPFYEQILGFNIVNETMTSIQYEVGMSNHFITLNEIANGREPLMSEAGLFNIGIMLPSLSDLADLLVQLSDYEIPVNGGEQSVATSLFIEDPEGNGLKFYVDQDYEEWHYEDDKVLLNIVPINVPRLLNEVSDEKWHGIPDDAKIGTLHLKSIRISEVKPYYFNYFGLEESAYMDDYSLFLSSQHYHHHLALNQWISGTKRVDNAHSYGLALVDFHYPETTHLNIKGPDGIYFRFNFIKEA